jgi:hypothetical protein
MQMSIDGLLVALLVVFAPEQHEPSPGNERVLAGLVPDPQVQQERRNSALTADPSACRFFADSEARRKCTIRTSRPAAASGSAETSSSYPESVIWMAPAEPAMPYKFHANPTR